MKTEICLGVSYFILFYFIVIFDSTVIFLDVLVGLAEVAIHLGI